MDEIGARLKELDDPVLLRACSQEELSDARQVLFAQTAVLVRNKSVRLIDAIRRLESWFRSGLMSKPEYDAAKSAALRAMVSAPIVKGVEASSKGALYAGKVEGGESALTVPRPPPKLPRVAVTATASRVKAAAVSSDQNITSSSSSSSSSSTASSIPRRCSARTRRYLRALESSSNKTGYIGVRKKGAESFIARMKKRGRFVHSNVFNSPKIAAVVYDIALREAVTRGFRTGGGAKFNFPQVSFSREYVRVMSQPFESLLPPCLIDRAVAPHKAYTQSPARGTRR